MRELTFDEIGYVTGAGAIGDFFRSIGNAARAVGDFFITVGQAIDDLIDALS